MEYYFQFAFILVQLLFIQSQDFNPNSLYQKFMMTNRSKLLPSLSSFSIKETTRMFSSYGFYKQFYSKTQVTTPIIDTYPLQTISKPPTYPRIKDTRRWQYTLYTIKPERTPTIHWSVRNFCYKG
jgi:hypothetical protein